MGRCDVNETVQAGGQAALDGLLNKVAAADWPDPVPLPEGLPPVPPMTLDMLPESLRPWIGDAAERMQCPLEYVGVGAVVALSSIVGRRCAIRPKRLDDWTAIPNLWGAVVGPASALKSPALREALAPLERLDARAYAKYEDESRDYRRSEVAAAAKRKALTAQIEKAANDDAAADVSKLQNQLAELEPRMPTARRYIVRDSTVEQLALLLQQNPYGLLLARDELTAWLYSLDREGHRQDRSFYLETWNGDGKFTVDRIGRGHVRLDSMCMSILGGIQPGPLSRYMKAALQPGADSDGLIQRFQLLVYPDILPEWRNIDRPPDEAARTRAHEIFRRLADLDVAAIGAIGNTEGAPPFLHYAEPAQKVADDYREHIEQRVRRPSDHPAVVSHLGKYRSLVPSLALLFHLADCVDGGEKGPVSHRAVLLAQRWTDYLLKHAYRVYGLGREGESSPARLLAERIRSRQLPDRFGAREAYGHGWTGLADKSDVEKAIVVLIEHDWLRADRQQTGGRPRIVYHVNPKVYR